MFLINKDLLVRHLNSKIWEETRKRGSKSTFVQLYMYDIIASWKL